MTDTETSAATPTPLALFADFAGVIDRALDALVAAGHLPEGLARGGVTCEPPREASHGDISTNAAMVLAKPAGTNPRALAALLVEELSKEPRVASAEIAGPGFINLRLADGASPADVIAQVDRVLEPYGGLGAIPQGQQVSAWTLENELSQLQMFGFLGIGFTMPAAVSR